MKINICLENHKKYIILKIIIIKYIYIIKNIRTPLKIRNYEQGRIY